MPLFFVLDTALKDDEVGTFDVLSYKTFPVATDDTVLVVVGWKSVRLLTDEAPAPLLLVPHASAFDDWV